MHEVPQEFSQNVFVQVLYTLLPLMSTILIHAKYQPIDQRFRRKRGAFRTPEKAAVPTALQHAARRTLDTRKGLARRHLQRPGKSASRRQKPLDILRIVWATLRSSTVASLFYFQPRLRVSARSIFFLFATQKFAPRIDGMIAEVPGRRRGYSA